MSTKLLLISDTIRDKLTEVNSFSVIIFDDVVPTPELTGVCRTRTR